MRQKRQWSFVVDSVFSGIFHFHQFFSSFHFHINFLCLVFSVRNPPWWNRRTRLERLLCAVTAITLMMCVAMSITLAMVRYQRQQQGKIDSRNRETI